MQKAKHDEELDDSGWCVKSPAEFTGTLCCKGYIQHQLWEGMGVWVCNLEFDRVSSACWVRALLSETWNQTPVAKIYEKSSY